MCTGFSHKVDFNRTYSIVSSTGYSLGYSYRDVCNDFGIPKHMTFGGYSSQYGQKNYSWRMSVIMTISNTYQVLVGQMGVLWRYQPENWKRDGKIFGLYILWWDYLSCKHWITRTLASTVVRCVPQSWSGYVVLYSASLRHSNFMHHGIETNTSG